MSSAEEDYSKSTLKSKPRRVTRACDSCRRKKIRCDGATSESNRCSNCNQYNYECTYVEAAKKRGPPKGYVESLEARLQKMESLLQRLCPDADFTRELGTHMDRETWYNEKQKRGGASALGIHPVKQSRPPSPVPENHISAQEDFPASDDDPSLRVPEDELKRLTVTSIDRRFHGKSSGLVLVQAAYDMKREYTGGDYANPEPTPQRHEFWADPAWEGKRVRAPDEVDVVNFEFPPPDLMEALIPHYFTRNNLYLPLLHRPTFERQYREGLYQRDIGYASILLLVCAIAARSSDDSRVLRGGLATEEDVKHSAGWKYFDQLHMHRKSLTSPATLSDLQQYALAAIFLQGSTVPYASWVMVGIGLRVAQDVGAHRKKVPSDPMTVEDELWKRAFWVLVNLDRMGSAALGRPCAIHDEDFDLDPPLEVDDEYWENPNPEEAFKQPPHLPSTVAYFNASIKLDQILSYVLRTIYSINKTKMLIGLVGEESWEQPTVATLDTMLNRWIDFVPEHLKWPQTNDDPVFFQQSANLYATYYHIQILVHRPFIPGPRKPATLQFPSLAICTNAARSCSRVLEAQRRKCGAGHAPHLMFYAFTSGLVLLLNIWGVNKPGSGGPVVDAAAAMQDVHKCMQFLNVAEKRWHLAGRLKDILCELASVGEFPLPHPSPEGSNKRERDSDSPKLAPPSDFTVPVAEPAVRPIAHPRSLITSRRAPPTVPAPSDFNTLPLNTVDLGRLPLHPDFLPQQQTASLSPPDTDMNWYAPEAFGNPAPVMQMFGGTDVDGATAGQLYLASMPPFVGEFAPQTGTVSQQPGFHNQQQPGGTLDMWSTAPQGFEWEDWNTFTTNIPNIIPGDRPDEQHNHQS